MVTVIPHRMRATGMAMLAAAAANRATGVHVDVGVRVRVRGGGWVKTDGATVRDALKHFQQGAHGFTMSNHNHRTVTHVRVGSVLVCYPGEESVDVEVVGGDSVRVGCEEGEVGVLRAKVIDGGKCETVQAALH